MSLENLSGNRPIVPSPARAVVAAFVVASCVSMAAFAAFPGENGKIAAETRRDGDPEIVTMAPDGSGAVLLTLNGVADLQPAWSADGSKLAFTSNRGGAFKIFSMSADGSGVRQLTSGDARDNFPAWSPDGLEVAFARLDPVTGFDDIWIVSGEGGSDPSRLTLTDDASELQPAWSPDGSKIAFVTDRDGNREIYVMDPDGSDPVRLTFTPLDEGSPDWSPDGTSIAFDSIDEEDGYTRVRILSADGSLQEDLPGTEPGDQQPAWSPDGLEIAFAGYRSDVLAVYRVTVGEPESRTLASDSASAGSLEQRPDWQPVAATPGNRPPVANAGLDGTVECAPPQGAEVTLDGSLSSDPDSTPGTNDDIVLFEWFLDFGEPSRSPIATGEVARVTLPVGDHVVTLRVTDGDGATATDEAVWVIREGQPPMISVSVDPSMLWPPNHKMVPVHASVTVTGGCGATSVVLAAATSSEPDDAPGGGDGHTVDDIQGADTGQPDYDLLVRAERSGDGPGRVYTIVFTATDAAGNASSASATVVVPHDAGSQELAVGHARTQPKGHVR
jgi:Tol biopolymer transport system component